MWGFPLPLSVYRRHDKISICSWMNKYSQETERFQYGGNLDANSIFLLRVHVHMKRGNNASE